MKNFFKSGTKSEAVNADRKFNTGIDPRIDRANPTQWRIAISRAPVGTTKWPLVRLSNYTWSMEVKTKAGTTIPNPALMVVISVGGTRLPEFASLLKRPDASALIAVGRQLHPDLVKFIEDLRNDGDLPPAGDQWRETTARTPSAPTTTNTGAMSVSDIMSQLM